MIQESLGKISFDNREPAYRQVTEQMRQLILSGALVAGEKLPSSEALVELWGLNQRTVHRGMSALVKEGLLDRRPRLGTFVRRRTAKLTRVGIYYTADLWAAEGSPFLRAVHRAVTAAWAAEGVETEVWVDPRPTTAEMGPWEPLVTAARRRTIQAVVTPQTDWPHIHWLNKLPVPVAHFSSSDLPNSVTVDAPQFVRLALQELKRQGCRSVAMLPAFPSSKTMPDGSPNARIYQEAMRTFVDTAADLRLAVRNDWGLAPQKHLASQAAVKRFGYEAMTALWGQPQRPEGVMVTDDVAATGVVAALLQLGVKVPEQIKLVLHKNSDVEIFCPVPVTFVEISTPAIAAALVSQIKRQLRGEPLQAVTIAFRVVQHPSKPVACPQPAKKGAAR